MALSASTERMLIHAACADPYHDFSHNHTFEPSRELVVGKPGLFEARSGLPTRLNFPLSRKPANMYNPDVLHKENQMLQELFQSSEPFGKGSYQYRVPNPLNEDKQFVKNICRAIASSPSVDGEKKIKHSFATLQGSESYTIKLLSDLEGNTNINDLQSLQAETSGKHKGREFRPSKLHVSDLFRFFGSDNINLLFDACSLNIQSLFKNALRDVSNPQTLHIHWLINREYLNDPATKPMTHDKKIMIESPAQIDYRYLIESDPNPITYIRYEPGSPNTPLQRDKFFSLLDFKLGPVIVEGNNDVHPKVRLEIFQDNNKHMYLSDDPSFHNQITQCCRMIREAIEGKTNNHILTSAHYQRKRSGDWFQALSCLDVGRLYYDRADPRRTPMTLSNKNIILVTHDRLLLWYAITLGLDVLFVGGKGLEEVGKEEGEEDSNYSEDEEAGPSGPVLYVMYFSNDKRRVSKAEIERTNLANAAALLPNVQKLFADIAVFNAHLKEIMEERSRNLERKFHFIVDVKLKQKIIDLFIEFVRFNALDYTPIDTTSFRQIVMDYQQKITLPDQEAKISSALLFISMYTTLRLKMDTLNSKDAIRTSDTFASDSSIFKESTMPLLYLPYDKSESTLRKSPQMIEREKQEQVTIVKLATLLTDSLSIDRLRQLRMYIDGHGFDEMTQTYVKNGEFVCINDILIEQKIDVFKTNLNILTSAIVSKLESTVAKEPAVAILVATLEKISEDDKTVTLYETSDPEPPFIFDQGTFNRKLEQANTTNNPITIAENDTEEQGRESANVAMRTEHERRLEESERLQTDLLDLSTKLQTDLDDYDLEELQRLQKKPKDRRTREEKQKIERLLELREQIPTSEERLKKVDIEYKKALAYAEEAKPAIFVPKVLPQKRSIRMRISNFFSVGPTLRSWANRATELFRGGAGRGGSRDGSRVGSRGVSRGGSGMKGIGQLSGTSSWRGGGDLDFWAYFLFVSYMNELIQAMNGFETSDNQDYKYFEGLARLVASHLDSIDAIDYKNIIQFLYHEIPRGKWSSRNDFARFVALAGHHISLKAINLMEGEPMNFGYSVEKYKETEHRYGDYITICNELVFEERHRFLVKTLVQHLETLPMPSISNQQIARQEVSVGERDFSTMPIDFFKEIYSMSDTNLRRTIDEAKLSPKERDNFMKAFQKALPELNKPTSNINFSNRRQFVPSVSGGVQRKTRGKGKGKRTRKGKVASKQSNQTRKFARD